MKIKRLTLFASCILTFTTSANAGEDLASKDELYTGKEYKTAFNNPKDNPDQPNVLLIGDSISIGYTVDVRKQLKGKADVFRIKTNARTSVYGTQNITKWLKGKKWDAIHFNWGLWDICYRNPKAKTQGHRDKVNGKLSVTPEKYKEAIQTIIAELKKTNAKLIWCATTPVPKKEAGRIEGDEIKYNLIAKEIMDKNNIAINDLHAHAMIKLDKIQKPDGDVHFTAEGSAYLAEKVASEILSNLQTKAK